MYNSEISYWQLDYKCCAIMLNSTRVYLSHTVSAEYRKKKKIIEAEFLRMLL